MSHSLRRTLTLIAVVALAVMGVMATPLMRTAALAADTSTCQPTGAVIPNAVDDLHFDADSVQEHGSIGYTIDFSLKSPAQAGDYFTFQLPSDQFQAGTFATTPVDIVYEGTNTVYGCAWQSAEGVVTAVFNDKAATLNDAHGTLSFTTRAYRTDLTEDVVVPIKVTDTKTVTITIADGYVPRPEPEFFSKEGWFTLPLDHQYFNITRGLSWRIFSPVFTSDVHNAHLVDNSYDPNWVFNCGWNDANVAPGSSGAAALRLESKDKSPEELAALAATITYSCSPEKLEVSMPVLPAGVQIKLPQVIAEITAPKSELNEVVLVNTAEFTGDEVETVYSNNQSVSASGSASLKDNPYMPKPSPKPSEAPSPAPSPSPSAPATPPAPVTPTATPTPAPAPSASPTPSEAPSVPPSATPTPTQPVVVPSTPVQPSAQPSEEPSAPAQPSVTPSPAPSATPVVPVVPTASATPSPAPSTPATPSAAPSPSPSEQPSAVPSEKPTATPSAQPSVEPSAQPSTEPSAEPTPTSSASAPAPAPSASPSAPAAGKVTGTPAKPSSTRASSRRLAKTGASHTALLIAVGSLLAGGVVTAARRRRTGEA